MGLNAHVQHKHDVRNGRCQTGLSSFPSSAWRRRAVLIVSKYVYQSHTYLVDSISSDKTLAAISYLGRDSSSAEVGAQVLRFNRFYYCTEPVLGHIVGPAACPSFLDTGLEAQGTINIVAQ